MIRKMNLSEETDGNLYGSSDYVPLACDGCANMNVNAVCCRQTDDTILLDPFDFCMLEKTLGMNFNTGYKKYFDLRVVDGIILPFLMKDADGACVFLNADGRCGIHDSRPGFCRLFPLGRLYDREGFSYILQTGQCPCRAAGKVTVAGWLGLKDPHSTDDALERYEKFVLSWHGITEKYQKEALNSLKSDESSEERLSDAGGLSVKLLKLFYLAPYDPAADFFEQYYARTEQS